MPEKEQALASLEILIETCKAARVSLNSLSQSTSDTESASVDVLRKDTLSIHRLIHTSSTRLSVALGKQPPSYPIALVPLKDLTSQVGQLTSCTTVFPPGLLRKEAVWAAETTIQALEALAQHFATICRQNKADDQEYLIKTGAVHDAVMKAAELSESEIDAAVKRWKVNAESLEDSLGEVKEMMEEKREADSEDATDDGWDELGEGFSDTLSVEEMDRVKKVFPLLRFTTMLHGKLLSHHILKPPRGTTTTIPHLDVLVAFSNSLVVASDDLASSLYAPQNLETIQESAEHVFQVITDLDSELGITKVDQEDLAEQLQRLQLGNGSECLTWFRRCFSQINAVYTNLHIM
ncbi:hypothetical protein BU17DRAFT_91654 [Hysterangium stoloniferum]|nr:hypothetical protein BU17DRAFT_91654 [Hysterangium stoloniferum]